MSLKIVVETVGPFAENAYFLVEPETGEAIAVDPGDEAPRLLATIRRQGLKIRRILATHGHLDHVGAVAAIRAASGAPFHVHPSDLFLVESIREQAELFGLAPPAVPTVDGPLRHGDVFTLGPRSVSIEVIETPGHSPGSVTLHVGGDLLVGDVLFEGSIGRTDLPGGDSDTLMASIRERLLVFPDETRVHPGHGPETTIGRERRSNPFLRSPE